MKVKSGQEKKPELHYLIYLDFHSLYSFII